VKLGIHAVPVLTSAVERAARLLALGMRQSKPAETRSYFPPTLDADDDVLAPLRRVSCP